MLIQALVATFQGSAYRATDVSSALTRVKLEGPGARSVLAKACSVNVIAESFSVGASTRTRFAGVPVVLCHARAAVFECIVAQSFRDYLLRWLQDAGAESVDGH